jgi:bisphosphoglycerate-independent phosphoglycerate mutase (AlkP superfamily)
MYRLDHPFAKHSIRKRMDVGLPNGQMGNSEVGHPNLCNASRLYSSMTETAF